jgi:predicted small secreted protein
MDCRLPAICIVLLALAAFSVAGPPLHDVSAASAGDPELVLVPSVNSTAVGRQVSFAGTAYGINATTATFFVEGPSSSGYNGTVPISSSQFQFNYTFKDVGNWVVFCVAGNASSPQAISNLIIVSVTEAPSPTFLGLQVTWLGAGALVISIVSLVSLAYVGCNRGREGKRRVGQPSANEPLK